MPFVNVPYNMIVWTECGQIVDSVDGWSNKMEGKALKGRKCQGNIGIGKVIWGTDWNILYNQINFAIAVLLL